jgi:very-short-patch-repair endonuclease
MNEERLGFDGGTVTLEFAEMLNQASRKKSSPEIILRHTGGNPREDVAAVLRRKMTKRGPEKSDDLISVFFGTGEGTQARVLQHGVAERGLRIARAVLASGTDSQREMSGMLGTADLVLTVADEDARVVDGSIAVRGEIVATARDAASTLEHELAAALKHEGFQLRNVQVVAQDPVEQTPVTTPKRAEVVEAVTEAIAGKKAYEVAAFCDRLGLPSHPEPEADPSKSKRVYARGRLEPLEISAVIEVAGAVLEELDHEQLEEVLNRYQGVGRMGTVKNLVFGSTRKPDVVLVDALSNDLGLVDADAALFYDGGIPEYGLSWRALVSAILPKEAAIDERSAARRLYLRLNDSLASPPERHFFRAYARDRYKSLGFEQPALIPQVWIHYDPRTRRQRTAPLFTAQRMDFLLLLERGRRVVIEIDGKTHFTDESGAPSPRRYAEMMRGDRDLQLRGYEVFRFGAAELPDESAASQVLAEFLECLLEA